MRIYRWWYEIRLKPVRREQPMGIEDIAWDLREKDHAAVAHLESHLIIKYTDSQLI